MNSFLLISPDQGSGFKPILSGKKTLNPTQIGEQLELELWS